MGRVRNDGLRRTILVRDRSASSPVVVHVPHAGLLVPAAHRGAFTIGPAELAAEHARLVDRATDRMVERAGSASLIASALSRFVVDVERFEGDAEEMNAVGMGVLYSHGTGRQPIRVLTAPEADRLLVHHRSYGEAFSALVGRTIAGQGRAVIVDVHSYPAEPLPYELHADDRRPQLCVGVDDRHTPAAVVEAVRSAFTGWDIAVNEPFRGTYVPSPFLGDPRVSSVMLEIRRNAYLDGENRIREEDLAAIAAKIRVLVDGIEREPPGESRNPQVAGRPPAI